MADEGVTKEALETALTATTLTLLERIERAETRLLTEFHKYARAAEQRTLVHEVASHTLLERMAAIETRVRELEAKAAGL